jgi:hypothetical protein
MKINSVKSISQWQSVIQTTNDIEKADGGIFKIKSNKNRTIMAIMLNTLPSP